MTNRPLNEYPEVPAELEKLARRMGFVADESEPAGEQFLKALGGHAQAIRQVFERVVRA